MTSGKLTCSYRKVLYSNRTDFIRTAIRNQLDKHNLEIQQSVTRHSFTIGALVYDKSDFEKRKAKGEKIKLNLIGVLHLASDISPELAREVIESIQVRGIFHASEAVKAALADRMK